MSTENNKIIAEFMDISFTKDNKANHPRIKAPYPPVECFKYSSDWNWLMEVVLRINILEYHRYSVRINQVDCKIYDSNNDKIIVDSFGRFTQKELIKAVYFSCVEFVKWYNQQNHKPC